MLSDSDNRYPLPTDRKYRTGNSGRYLPAISDSDTQTDRRHSCNRHYGVYRYRGGKYRPILADISGSIPHIMSHNDGYRNGACLSAYRTGISAEYRYNSGFWTDIWIRPINRYNSGFWTDIWIRPINRYETDISDPLFSKPK